MTLVGSLKNIFFIILMIVLLPLIPVIKNTIERFYAAHFDPRAHVAVLPIKGLLYDSTYYTKQLEKLFKDDTIKAIMLKIECPGSASGTAQAIYQEILALKAQYPNKFVLTLVENVCASGGYYIAIASDYIIACPSAIVGSVGVRFGQYLYFQLKDFIENYKIHYKVIQAGAYKNSTDPLIDRTPQDTAMLQSVLDDTYQQFTEDVANRRHLAIKDAPQWAEGKLFTARQAKKIGLIDEIGSLALATKTIKERTFIEGDIKWVYAEKPSGLSWLLGSSEPEEQAQATHSWIKSFISLICTEVESQVCTRQTTVF